jgi:hypothetical protein
MEKELYKVVKIMRKLCRCKILNKKLSIDEAKRIVNSYPDSQKSMVVFYKM